MAYWRGLTLTEEQRRALIQARDHAAQPQLRERCAALLKIAAGRSPHWVALHGLLKARDPDTVYGWLNLYETEGLEGLRRRRHGGPRRHCF